VNGKEGEGGEERDLNSRIEQRVVVSAYALCDMHVGEAVVHHVSKEDDCMWTRALGNAPGLAQIHVDEDPGDGPEERAASRVRPPIENLRIGDDEDVSRLSFILITAKRRERDQPVNMQVRNRKKGRGECKK
jgi:hypothetical protein